MTFEELQAIRLRAIRATPGPWAIDGKYISNADGKTIVELKDNYDGYPECGQKLEMEFEIANDREFLENAHNDIVALLAEIDWLQIKNERQRQRLQKAGQLIYRAIPAPGDLDEMEKWYRDRDEFLQESKPLPRKNKPRAWNSQKHLAGRSGILLTKIILNMKM